MLLWGLRVHAKKKKQPCESLIVASEAEKFEAEKDGN